MKFKTEYKPLCSGWYLFYRYPLWMGKDHLLHIATGVFVEEYKRFYFRDIQSLMVQQSKSWILVNIILAVLVAGLIFLAMAFGELMQLISGILALIMVAILVVNFIRGPGCVCYIQTAVQKQKLRSISRIKKAQQIMDSLKPIILRSQQEG